MKNLFFTSTTDSTGKTALCLGIAQVLKEKGLNVGYFKPISVRTALTEDQQPVDEDVLLMKAVLGLDDPLETLSPIVIKEDYFVEFLNTGRVNLLNRILDAYKRLKERYDYLIIESHGNPDFGLFLTLSPPTIAKELDNTRPILVAKPRRPYITTVVDSLIATRRSFFVRTDLEPLGYILNGVPEVFNEDQWEEAKRFLDRSFQLPSFGEVPEQRELLLPTIEEILLHVPGKLLVDVSEDRLQRPVDKILIGAMNVSAAKPYLRKYTRKLLITGGDRSDMILAALETDTSGIICTGDVNPAPTVITEARERGVPLICVPFDTLTTMEHLNRLYWRISVNSKYKIQKSKELVEKYVNLDELLKMIE